MASGSCSNRTSVLKMLHKKATHHYHFHGVRDQERCLTLMSADCSDDWKHIPELTPINQYYCVQLESHAPLLDQGAAAFDIRDLKEKLKKYMKFVEDNQAMFSFRFEARFGHLFLHPNGKLLPDQLSPDFIIKEKSLEKKFIVRLHNQSENFPTFLRRNCVDEMDPSRRKEVTFKIIFKVYDCRSGSKNEGICYVECNDSSFNLQSVESSNGGATALRVDIIRPGRRYYIRLVGGVHIYNAVTDDLKLIAEKITRSMQWSSFNPEELRMQLVGEDFEVQFIRKKLKIEHKSKKNPSWILAEQDTCEYEPTKQTLRILKSDEQYCPIPIPLQTEKKEIELWSRVHSPPKESEKWTTDELLKPGSNFDEFVTTCFDIAGKLDEI